MNPKISVIVPVYKAEKYLHRCVDSILAQTFTDFEVLLIDDGSPDRSGEICDEYAKKDERIRVFHMENGGASSARNIGLVNAYGEWISFIDSDDWVDEDYLNNLIKNSIGVDLVMSGFRRVYFDGRIINCPSINISCYSKDVIGKYMYEIDSKLLLNSQCTKLFNNNIIKDYNIKFINGLSVCEDMLFCFEYFSKCNSVRCINYIGYNYQISKYESLSKTIFDYETYHNSINKLYSYRCSFCDLYKISDDRYYTYIKQELFRGYCWSTTSFKRYGINNILRCLINIKRDCENKEIIPITCKRFSRERALGKYINNGQLMEILLIILKDKILK